MNIICSPSGIVDPFCPGQGIIDIANAGFENLSLELDMYNSPSELEDYGKLRNHEKDKKNKKENKGDIGSFYEKMLSACREKRLRIPIARAPYLLRDTKRSDLGGLMLKIYEEAIRFCGKVGCKYIVIRPFYPVGTAGIQEDVNPEESYLTYGDGWSFNRECYLRLAAVAKENNMMILLENQCRSMNGHMVRSVCSDSAVAARWVDELNREAGEERFGFCMDVGVCSLCGQDMHEFAAALGGRIKAVILRDCDGQREGAMLPFTCSYLGQPQTDWLSLIRGLREIGFDGQLVLDIRDTAAAFSPLLRPQLMALARASAEYFKWQTEIENLLKKYSSIALFGAGNMCRNYLKCYGEKYPPLFTCDNNRKLWGTYFCGLEVKPPEALKEVPDGCGIFICNIYYREIEQQLRGMGIENIEFFNDEYMPSFYFDRLERERE